MTNKLLDKSIKFLTELIFKNVEKVFIRKANAVKNIIMDEYDSKLMSISSGLDSKSNPSLYRAEFKLRLDNFDYVDEVRNGYVFNTPDVANFDFSGRLQIIKTVLAGVVGEYIEMDLSDYSSVFKVLPVKIESGDTNLSDEVDMVVLRYNSDIQRAEVLLNKKFNPYPFSNMPPVDIFMVAENYVNDNISRWTKEAKELALKEFKTSFRGV